MAFLIAPYGMTPAGAAPAVTAGKTQITAAAPENAVSASDVKEAGKPDTAASAADEAAEVKTSEGKEAQEEKETKTEEKDKAGSKPAAVLPAAKASLDDAFDHLSEVKNGTYDMDLATSAPAGSANMASHITFVSEPYTRAKGSMNITFILPGAPAFEREISYYIRETEKATAFYCKLGHGEWEKSITPRKANDKKVNDFWSAAFTNGFMDLAKDVQFGVKDGSCQTYLVTVDGKAFGKLLQEQLLPMSKDENMKKTTEEICRSLPDFTYTVTIDTEKNLLTDVHANLTEPIRKAASIIVKRRDMPRSERDKMLKEIRESTVDLHLQGRDFNALEDVQVPAEILANAKATELPLAG
ncbi:hypothetical protein [Mitsuokella sp.]|uniref:hypothetical protein n=1 Tax=Mitsuokella sp. TaxID=2049034 RepID=UPI003D7D9B4F